MKANGKRWLLAWATVGCVACASEPGTPRDSDGTAGEATVVIGPEGFGTLDGQRMPWELIVLRLRQRVRALPPGGSDEFVVRLALQQGVADAAQQRRMQDDHARMQQQIDVMDIGHVQYFVPEVSR